MSILGKELENKFQKFKEDGNVEGISNTPPVSPAYSFQSEKEKGRERGEILTCLASVHRKCQEAKKPFAKMLS